MAVIDRWPLAQVCLYLSQCFISYVYFVKLVKTPIAFNKLFSSITFNRNIFFPVYRKLIEILSARGDERYAGEDIKVPGFDGLPLPDEFIHAKEHRLLPIFVMPDHMEDVAMGIRTLSRTVKVSWTSNC